jgi:cytochrome c-type biogenesis protein CcmH/NrfG
MATMYGSNGPKTGTGSSSKQIYALGSFCLVLCLVVGYFVSGKSTRAIATPGRNARTTSRVYHEGHPGLTFEQMKQRADMQASTLIEKSKSEPKNVGLLVAIAGIYQVDHQFTEAASYYDRALESDPTNVPARTELASCLYYSGGTDGALSQLNKVLKDNPGDINALFNLGVIRYQGKNDPAGAVTAWQKLLQTNPNLERKPLVEQLIAEAKAARQ